MTGPTREERITFLRAEIRREHAKLWGCIPSLSAPPDARLSSVWLDAHNAVFQLCMLSAELEGYEAKP